MRTLGAGDAALVGGGAGGVISGVNRIGTIQQGHGMGSAAIIGRTGSQIGDRRTAESRAIPGGMVINQVVAPAETAAAINITITVGAVGDDRIVERHHRTVGPDSSIVYIVVVTRECCVVDSGSSVTNSNGANETCIAVEGAVGDGQVTNFHQNSTGSLAQAAVPGECRVADIGRSGSNIKGANPTNIVVEGAVGNSQ